METTNLVEPINLEELDWFSSKMIRILSIHACSGHSYYSRGKLDEIMESSNRDCADRLQNISIFTLNVLLF